MRTITLAFLVLIVLVLVVYWRGTVQVMGAFTAAAVQVGNNLSGRNSKGQFQNYPGSTGSGTSPASPADPCGCDGSDGCPKGQKKDVFGICFPCWSVGGICP